MAAGCTKMDYTPRARATVSYVAKHVRCARIESQKQRHAPTTAPTPNHCALLRLHFGNYFCKKHQSASNCLQQKSTNKFSGERTTGSETESESLCNAIYAFYSIRLAWLWNALVAVDAATESRTKTLNSIILCRCDAMHHSHISVEPLRNQNGTLDAEADGSQQCDRLNGFIVRITSHHSFTYGGEFRSFYSSVSPSVSASAIS